jgi:hypothetical protein
MSATPIPADQDPAMDDRRMWDLLSGMFAYPAVLVSHDLGLFTLLAERPRMLPQLSEALGIEHRPLSVLLGVNASLGLVRRVGGEFHLTPYAEAYFLKTSPTSFTGYLDMTVANYATHSVESLKKAVLTNTAQAYEGKDWVQSHDEEAALARTFTLGMHGLSMGPAQAWPKVIDLSDCRLMLDIGGGSGAHSIGAAQRYSELRAIVLDLPAVCGVADEVIAGHGMGDRVQTQAFDYWEDPFPSADFHFYSNSYQGWPPERCGFLTEKSFDSLEPGGRIAIHEIVYNDDKTGPVAAATMDVLMLLWVQGQQLSGAEFSQMLETAGFTDVKVTPTFGYWSVVTGRKP